MLTEITDWLEKNSNPAIDELVQKQAMAIELNEAKKALYKEKPVATLLYIRKGSAYYFTSLADGSRINFTVPVDDMGDTDYQSHMDAKLLIRYIVI